MAADLPVIEWHDLPEYSRGTINGKDVYLIQPVALEGFHGYELLEPSDQGDRQLGYFKSIPRAKRVAADDAENKHWTERGRGTARSAMPGPGAHEEGRIPRVHRELTEAELSALERGMGRATSVRHDVLDRLVARGLMREVGRGMGETTEDGMDAVRRMSHGWSPSAAYERPASRRPWPRPRMAREDAGPQGALDWKQIGDRWEAHTFGGAKYVISPDPNDRSGFQAWYLPASKDEEASPLGNFSSLGAAMGAARRHQPGEKRAAETHRRRGRRTLTVPQKHQLKIAYATLRMPDEVVGVMGGPNKEEARQIIRDLTGKEPKESGAREAPRRASGDLTDDERAILASADSNGFIEADLVYMKRYGALDRLAKRGLVEHRDYVPPTVDNPEPGLQKVPGPVIRHYVNVRGQSKTARDDVFYITAAGRAAVAVGAREAPRKRSAVPIIRTTFSKIIPAGEDEYPDTEDGWIDEEGVSMVPEDYEADETVVSKAVKFLRKEGVTEASSTAFHPGVWYSTEYSVTDYGTGEEEQRSFHLDGFTEEHEREVYNELFPRYAREASERVPVIHEEAPSVPAVAKEDFSSLPSAQQHAYGEGYRFMAPHGKQFYIYKRRPVGQKGYTRRTMYFRRGKWHVSGDSRHVARLRHDAFAIKLGETVRPEQSATPEVPAATPVADVVAKAATAVVPAMAEEMGLYEAYEAKLTASKRRALPASAFALPERRELPILDKKHIKPALSRLSMMLHQGSVSRAEFDRAHRRIARRGRHFGISVGAAEDCIGLHTHATVDPAALARSVRENVARPEGIVGTWHTYRLHQLPTEWELQHLSWNDTLYLVDSKTIGDGTERLLWAVDAKTAKDAEAEVMSFLREKHVGDWTFEVVAKPWPIVNGVPKMLDFGMGPESEADEAPRRANQCNCENAHCPHGEHACPNDADPKLKVMYVGSVCASCYNRMPEKYRLAPGASEARTDVRWKVPLDEKVGGRWVEAPLMGEWLRAYLQAPAEGGGYWVRFEPDSPYRWVPEIRDESGGLGPHGTRRGHEGGEATRAATESKPLDVPALAHRARSGRDGSVIWVESVPGDGGVDWGYTGNSAAAIPLSPYWQRRFAKAMRDVGDGAVFVPAGGAEGPRVGHRRAKLTGKPKPIAEEALRAIKGEGRGTQIDAFTRGYIGAALWSTMDNSDPDTGGDPLDKNYGIEDLAPSTLAQMKADAEAFQKAEAKDLKESGLSDSDAGYDFWLTREGHGTGFWDRGLGDVGERLSKAAKAYGEFDLYVGDDGKIYAGGYERAHRHGMHIVHGSAEECAPCAMEEKQRKTRSKEEAPAKEDASEPLQGACVAVVERNPGCVPSGIPIETPEDVYKLMKPRCAKLGGESFYVLGITNQGELLGAPVEVAKGQPDRVAVDIEQIMAAAIGMAAAGARGFIVCHAHPSGGEYARPSASDKRLTQDIRESAKIACPSTAFIDHVIVAAPSKKGIGSFYSFGDGKVTKVNEPN